MTDIRGNAVAGKPREPSPRLWQAKRMKNPISSINKSIMRNLALLIDDWNAENLTVNPVEWHSWDSRADEDKLPAKTLVGLEGLTWEENQGLWIVRHGIGVSSFRDANLLNELELLDFIHDRTGEGKKLQLVDPVTAEVLTELVTSAWQLSPMAQSQLRNYRTVSLELRLTAGVG